MAKLLVAGGLNEADDPAGARTRFAAALGRQIIRRGHTLLGGCRTGLDSVVAKAAFDAATSKPADPRKVIRSWVTGSTQPSHAYGEIMRSQLGDWVLIPRGFAFPEPIQEADAVVIVGGWDGTHHAASWGRIAGRPILPVATFGGAAADIYKEELTLSERRNATPVPRGDSKS